MPKSKSSSAVESDCPCCGEDVAGTRSLTCKGCGVVYHSRCRLGLGRCLSEGCSRSKPILISSAPAPKSVLDRDVSALFGAHYDSLGRPVLSTGLGILATAAFVGLLLGRALFL
jgi:hypothetical protein